MSDEALSADKLRERLATALEESGPVISPVIGRAFRAVPRHLFVPDTSIDEAYHDDVIFTKSADGISLSASSAPSIMAEMLESLDIHPGQRVLEVGAGTGYNAALLAEITGPSGLVVTIDIDHDVVEEAKKHLAAAGYDSRVIIHCADGGLGWSENGPYDRIIVTVGAWDISSAWFDQLIPGGRLVVPLEFRDVHKLVTFERQADRLVSLDVRDCRFVRPRGVIAGPGRQLPLSDGLYLSTSRPELDLASIRAAVAAGPSVVVPLPIAMTPEELHGAFRLWLALSADDFCLISLEASAFPNAPVRPWQTTATHQVVAPDPDSTFASAPGILGAGALCLLERADHSDRVPVLRGYGQDAAALVDTMSAYAREWEGQGRPLTTGLTIEAWPATQPTIPQPGTGLVAQKRWFRYVIRPARGPENADAAGTDNYWYISHTPQGIVRPVERLIQAARTWQPCDGEVVTSFDFLALAERVAPKLEPTSVVSQPRGPNEIADSILDVLNLSKYRRGPAENLNAIRAQLLPRMSRRIAEGLPIRITIPSFPGRPYNPITHQRVAPDLGEAYAFILLSRISRHVATVYPPGIQFVICLDGTAYNPFYGYTNEADHQYPVDLQRFLDLSGIRNAVSIVDLQDFVDERADEFQRMRDKASSEIAQRWRDPDYTFRDELIETMKMGTNTVAVNAAAVYLTKYYDQHDDASTLIERMRDAVASRAKETAFEYMVFLTAIREMNLIDSKYPDSIRGTVHPKPGQYAPYLVEPDTSIAPWHGVAVLRSDGTVNTVYESEIFAETSRYTAVYLRGDYTPFYYQEKSVADEVQEAFHSER